MEQKAKGFYFLLAFLLTNSFRYWDKKGTEVTFKKQQGAKHKKEKVCYFKEYRGKNKCRNHKNNIARKYAK